MRIAKVAVSLLAVVFAAVAQTDRGTITGTVSDPAGAVVANAAIEARNVATAQVYPATSTATGNFTIVNLPAGSYELSANVQGFKKYSRQGLTLAPTQTLRVDMGLEVGSNAETVTVTAEATLLKTENGELATNVTGDRLNNLPLLGIGPQGASAAGIRNPWALAQLVPGAQFSVPASGFFAGIPQMTVNGAPTTTSSYRVEGMDAGNNGTLAVYTFQTQPSAEAIQEVAVQTSNFAAEYGMVGGGLFNATMRSGTNQYHGSLYNYNVNEAYNARQPYTGLLNKARRNDYGGSLGGPVWIPKVYNGKDRTFFFWNFEQFRESQTVLTQAVTVPTPEYRNGDFSKLFGYNNNLPLRTGLGAGAANYVDPLGRTPILSGTIFDPRSFQTVVVDGQNRTVRNPFPENKIPLVRQDQVALNIQKLIPNPRGPNALTQVGGNFNGVQNSQRTTEIPSLKLDQSIGSKGHLSFYWSRTVTADQYPIVGSPAVPEGFPSPITTAIGNFDNSHTERVNYDHSLSPTLLLHVGVGFMQNLLTDNSPDINYDVFKNLGLKGATAVRNFPTINISSVAGLPVSIATGGMSNMGPSFQLNQALIKPAANLSLTWVRNNHTWKVGGEWRAEGNPQVSNVQPPWSNAGSFAFASSATGQTALEPITLSQGSVGFAYASFLLGQVTSYGLGVPAVYKFGKQQYALFLQDTWKVTRKLTLDYGLRWDYGTYPRETYGRIANFSRTIPNPTAGGHPGGVIYEALCDCKFASNYPYALGPRIGVAFQLNSKTVIRGGFGVVYNVTNVPASTPLNYQTGGTPGFNLSLFDLQDGPPASIRPTFPNFSPGALPLVNTVGGPPVYIDPNAARPARQYQWSVSISRELTRNLVVEASYVANRGIWWSTGGSGGLAPVNSMSEDRLKQYGFTVGNNADRILLNTQIGQLGAADRSALAARGIVLPYSGFPTTQALFQSLLPFPQYTGNISPSSAPLGKTWYDSLQTTVTQRLSHGLTVNGNFTWSKNLDMVGLANSSDIFNRGLAKNLSANDLPLQLRISAQYTTPTTNGFGSKMVSYLLKDWNVGWYMQYQSAPVLIRPSANAGTFPISQWLGAGRGPGPAERVPGQPLFSNNWVDSDGKQRTDELDINCHCYDPTKTVVLNPAAWAGVPDGKWSSNFSTIREFRGIRYPTENANLGRTFRIKERATLNVRIEFANVFNRLRLPQPSTAGVAAAPVRSPITGLYTTGYGTIIPTAGTSGQRAGTIVARIVF